LAPLAWLAIFIGLAVTFFIDPMSAQLNKQYEDDKERMSSIVQIADKEKATKSIWITLPSTEGQIIIYGNSNGEIMQNSFSISNATIYVYDKSGLDLQKTIDTKIATRKDKQLILSDANVTYTGNQSEYNQTIKIGLADTTSLEGTREPKVVPLWELPSEAHLAKQNGGSPEKYWLRFYRLLMLPVTILAMVLFAAIMSIGLDRSGGKIRSVLIAIAIGISMYFFNEIAGLMASSGNIPGLIAAICPPVFALTLTLALISYREDGQV
jgi:lipopolysaccharide export LptBFGC system permease protein LptF